MMKIRRVKLNHGPHDGTFSIASHDTAIVGGEVYVQDGGENADSFIHAKTLVTADRSPVEIGMERMRVENWMRRPPITVKGIPKPIPAPMSELVGIPPHRINAWYQLLKLES